MRDAHRRLMKALVAALGCGAVLSVTVPATASAANVIGDGGFEAATTSGGILNSPAWNEDDTIYESPLCNTTTCGNASGTIGPNQGSSWAVFGASGRPHAASIDQALPLNGEGTWVGTLSFQLWSGIFQDPSAELDAIVDGLPVFSLDSSNQSEFAGGYHPVSAPVKIVSRTPSEHKLRFQYFASPTNSQVTTANVDDVALDLVPWNEFLVEKGFPTRRDLKRGTSPVLVTVPGAGTVSLFGKKVKRAKATTTEVDEQVELRVRAKGKAKRKLARKGKAKVPVTVTYTPNDGTAAEKTEKVKLFKKRRARR